MRSHNVILLIVAVACGLIASMSVSTVMRQTDHDGVPGEYAFGDFPMPQSNIDWPPKIGEPYPDLALRDVDGNAVQLSSFRGNVLLIEPVGVACRGCQAFAGGHTAGGLFGKQPQAGLRSIHEYVESYGGVSLDDDRIQTIQILFYGSSSNDAPTLAEAKKWADHYRSVAPRTTVLVADLSMVNATTRAMIPGFHLVDRDFILRCAAGNPPQQDLYRDLLPKIAGLLIR